MKFSQLFLNSLLTLVIFLDLIHVMFSRRSNTIEKCLEKLSKTNLKLNFLKISLPALYRKHRERFLVHSILKIAKRSRIHHFIDLQIDLE